MAPGDEERRNGVGVLTEQIRALVESHKEIKSLLQSMSDKLAAAEMRSMEACKECAMWTRVGTLEKEMAGINGRIAGVALAAGLLAFLANWFVRR